MRKKIIIKALVLVLGLTLIAIFAYALDYPHTGTNNIGCESCHYVHGDEPSLLPEWTAHTPQDIDDTQYNTLCWGCHNDIEAPYQRTHSSLQIDNSYGDWTVECKTCHNPHYQKQFRTYGSESYLHQGTVLSITTTTLTEDSAGWTVDEYKGLVVIPNIDEINYSYKIQSNTNDTLTIKGPVDLAVVSPGDTFAIVYGKLIKSTIPTPNSGDKTAKFFRDSGTNSFADGDTAYDGVCEVCHTQTNHFRNDGLGPDQSHTNMGAVAATRCTKCHQHVYGFRGMASGAHTTHLSADYGPNITCSDGNFGCHGTYSPPIFSDGQNLANTTACNTCHSPGGSYDGVDDADIGAKNNWTDGVYTDNNLITGKEKWCAGCHDEDPANSKADGTGVDAPNVIGDENAATRYGTGYGFYKTGHGLPSNETYPATGYPGAGVGCLDCHDAGMQHIDGIARTYQPDSDYLTYDPVSANYQNGFRLKDVATGYDGKYPMHIPRTGHVYPPGFREDWEFALCFKCHNRDKLFDGVDQVTGEGAGTNFYALSSDDGGGNPAPTPGLWYSMHDVHTWGANGPLGPETPQYDSDFDGTADSRMSCPSCHNVHGSPSPAMFRNGELTGTSPVTGIIPFFDFQYIGPPLCGATNYPMLPDSTGGAGTRFYASGPGDVSRNGVCNMCHNEYWFESGSEMTGYTRTPLDIITPRISSVSGEVGSIILLVRFSEGVYNSASVNLTTGDFTLTDSDNSRTIDSVAHIAGDATAMLTLNSPLDAVDDIGTDTLSAATDASIYDASGNAMDTTTVTIDEDTDSPAISNQNPANGATDIAINSNLTLTLSDIGVGVDWTTFSIQLSGNGGYSEIYTNASPEVSKTGTPGEYDITVDPDVYFGSGEVITVTVNTDDLSGNSMTPPSWSFTAGTQGTVTLHPSGVASDGGFTATGSTWADVLDCNDGDTSYVSYCCDTSGQIFSVNMDDLDSAELQGRLIEGITLYMYAEYTNGSGNTDIGYNTGTTTVWKGSIPVSESEYTLITSTTYATDSDGGSLHLSDINDLRILVKRNAVSSPELRVTEVYAKIAFGATIDTTAPSISTLSPADSATNVALNNDLTFTLSDTESGIDWSTFSIQLSGNKGYSQTYTDTNPEVSKTGTPGSYDVTVNPGTDFGNEETITVTVNVDDQAGNSLVPPAWSFTTEAAGGPLTIVLHPSGLVSQENCTTTGGGWDTILDSNDGDVTKAVCNASLSGTTMGSQGWVATSYYSGLFTVVMDPAGLGGATINRVTLYAVLDLFAGDPDINLALFEICFNGTATCALTNDTGGYATISVDHPNPASLNLDSLSIDGTVSLQDYYYGYAAGHVTEVAVEVEYVP